MTKEFNKNKKYTKTIKIIRMVLVVILFAGLFGNSNDGSLESKIAHGITALCGLGVFIITIYLLKWKQ